MRGLGDTAILNHIVIMGRLTRAPELRYTKTQLPVCSFTLAVERDYKSGEEKKTDFIDCSAWRKTAEFVNTYFTKGTMAVVSGRLQYNDWTDKDGAKRRSAEVLVENIYFGESKREAINEDSDPASGTEYSALQDADGKLPF